MKPEIQGESEDEGAPRKQKSATRRARASSHKGHTTQADDADLDQLTHMSIIVDSSWLCAAPTDIELNEGTHLALTIAGLSVAGSSWKRGPEH